MSTAIATRSSFSPTNVGRRPRGGEPIAPSRTQFSSISCSTICEIVLLPSPDRRARSAREMGWLARISSRTISRLMMRAVSLVASCNSARSMCRMPFHSWGKGCNLFQKTRHPVRSGLRGQRNTRGKEGSIPPGVTFRRNPNPGRRASPLFIFVCTKEEREW